MWSRDTLTTAERIRAFGSEFPKTAVKGALGNRTNLISVLLMGLDVEQFPPFRVGVFTRAYDSAGYGRPEGEADEAAVYEHALAFLDRFIDEAAERGLELRHRLDAQSVVWGMPETIISLPPPQLDDLTLSRPSFTSLRTSLATSRNCWRTRSRSSSRARRGLARRTLPESLRSIWRDRMTGSISCSCIRLTLTRTSCRASAPR